MPSSTPPVSVMSCNLYLQVDAIVNSTDCGLHLEGGGLSHALLQHAGQTLQVECLSAAPNGIKYGEVVTTSGGQLTCQVVIHGACCHWDGEDDRSEQVMSALESLSVSVLFIILLYPRLLSGCVLSCLVLSCLDLT